MLRPLAYPASSPQALWTPPTPALECHASLGLIAARRRHRPPQLLRCLWAVTRTRSAACLCRVHPPGMSHARAVRARGCRPHRKPCPSAPGPSAGPRLTCFQSPRPRLVTPLLLTAAGAAAALAGLTCVCGDRQGSQTIRLGHGCCHLRLHSSAPRDRRAALVRPPWRRVGSADWGSPRRRWLGCNRGHARRTGAAWAMSG